MSNLIELAKAALARYDLPVDCDCDDDDCVKCSHYPTFHMAAAEWLRKKAPDLARALIDTAAERDALRERVARLLEIFSSMTAIAEMDGWQHARTGRDLVIRSARAALQEDTPNG